MKQLRFFTGKRFKAGRLANLFLLVFCLAVLLAIQVNNMLHFPANRGFDAGSHMQYVDYLKDRRRLPLPFEGFELYQPPLYYLILALLPSPYGFRFFSFALWLCLALMVFFFLHKQSKELLLSLTATLISVSLPVVLYLTYAISNEFFSAFLITAALAYYTINKLHLTLQKSVILGVLIALALLAKATAWLLVSAIAADQLFSARNNKPWKFLLITFSTAFLIAGWFYLKNMVLFHNPLIASYDFPKLHPLNQAISPRNLAFFLDLSPFWKADLFQAHHYSFICGTYFSWFYDGHNIIVPVQDFSKAGALLIAASLPLFFLSVSGFFLSFSERNLSFKTLSFYTVLLFISYLLYNFRLPHFSTVKGAFLVSNILPFSAHLMLALKKLAGRRLFFFLILLASYIFLLLRCFLIQPSWYL